MNIMRSYRIGIYLYTCITLFSHVHASDDYSFINMPDEIVLNIFSQLQHLYAFPCDTLRKVDQIKWVCHRWGNLIKTADMPALLNIPPMHYAAATNNVDEMIRLKRVDKHSIFEPDDWFCTPHDYAHAMNQKEARELLQSAAAAKLDKWQSCIEHTYTAEELGDALKQDNPDKFMPIFLQRMIVPLLIANYPHNKRWSAVGANYFYFIGEGRVEAGFHGAVSYKSMDRLEQVHKNPCNLKVDFNAHGMDGLTLLHRACMHEMENLDTLKFLLEIRDVNINCISKDKKRSTPLHLATSYNNNKTVAALLATGKCAIDMVDSEGKTALYVAVLYNNYTGAEILLKHNANVLCRDKVSNMDPVMQAASDNTTSNILHLLYSTGNYDINMKNDLGFSPLSYAVYGDADVCTQYLINNKADVTVLDKDKNNLLHIAVSSKKIQSIPLLNTVLGNKINDKNMQGYTALHFAAYVGKLSVVTMLVGYGANIKEQTANNKTAYILAKEWGHQDVADYLLKAELIPSVIV